MGGLVSVASSQKLYISPSRPDLEDRVIGVLCNCTLSNASYCSAHVLWKVYVDRSAKRRDMKTGLRDRLGNETIGRVGTVGGVCLCNLARA